MISFDLKFNGKIKLWFDDVEVIRFIGEKAISKEYTETSGDIISEKTIIAEIFLPRGGRNIYGLLGLKYKPIKSSMLKVIVNCSEKDPKTIFKNSLIQKIEPAFIGISDEYSQYIMNRIDFFYKNNQLDFNGELNFCYGAYAEVSSNGWVFDKLTNILLTTLHMSKNDINSDVLMSLID